MLMNESAVDGKKMPDHLWRGRMWDLKTISSKKAANSAIRHGLQQIREIPGGIILDLVDHSFSMEQLETVMHKRMQ